MGVELCMWQISPENLAKLLSSEEAIDAFMESQFPDPDSPDAVQWIMDSGRTKPRIRKFAGRCESGLRKKV